MFPRLGTRSGAVKVRGWEVHQWEPAADGVGKAMRDQQLMACDKRLLWESGVASSCLKSLLSVLLPSPAPLQPAPIQRCRRNL